jgi:hypothetical protein
MRNPFSHFKGLLAAAAIMAGCNAEFAPLGPDSGTNNSDVVVAADMGAPIDNGPSSTCGRGDQRRCFCAGDQELRPTGIQTCSDDNQGFDFCVCPMVDAGTPDVPVVDNGPVQPICSPPCGLTQTCGTGNVCMSNCSRPCVGRETCVLTGENGWSCLDLSPPPVDAGTPDVPVDAPATCLTGSASCDGNQANGCEVNTATDENNCGSCGNVCRPSANNVGVCLSGRCGTACNAGFGNCNATPGDGCETDMRTSLTSCGACGNACPARDNATTTCSSGVCGFTCLTGYADCDRNPSNGCEVNVRTSESSCGACGTVCGVGRVCSNGSCQFTCNPGDGGVPLTSCVGGATCISLNDDLANCGACGNLCATNFEAHGVCTGGVCSNACNTGFGDCDRLVANGCERELLSDVANCGRCGNACPARANAATTCVASWCGYTCSAGFGDCDYSSFNGCETNTRTDTLNCGGCGRACPSGQSCSDGRCVGPISPTCPPGRTDCRRSFTSGPVCVDLAVERTDCGRCGYGCWSDEICSSGSCRVCPSGQVACNNVCTNIRTSAANCGGCGIVCGSGQACLAGVCTTPCASGQIMCGGACTSTQTDTNNCGACGNVCPVRANVNGITCLGGVCGYNFCNPGFGDCFNGAADGCETVLSTNSNCGACGRTCASGTTCSGGTCVSTTPVDAGTPDAGTPDAGMPTDSGMTSDVAVTPINCAPGFSPRTLLIEPPPTIPAGCGTGSSGQALLWGQYSGEMIGLAPGMIVELAPDGFTPMYLSPLPVTGAPLTPRSLQFTDTSVWLETVRFHISGRCGNSAGTVSRTVYDSFGHWIPFANYAAAGGHIWVNVAGGGRQDIANQAVREGSHFVLPMPAACVR